MANRHYCSILVGLLCLTFHFQMQGQVVAPNFSIIGTRGESPVRLLESPQPGVYPDHVSLDISTNGLINGLQCEYEGKQEIFEKLKAQIQKSMEASPRIEETNFVAWRNEKRKFSVSLSYMALPSEGDEKKVTVIGLSVDKKIRGR